VSASPLESRVVRRLAVPAILHSLLQTLVFVVDRIMLGRHGEASLAAMQVGGALEWSVWSVFAAFQVGTIARVGRHVGAREPAAARRAAWLSLAMASGIGGALALAPPLVLLALAREQLGRFVLLAALAAQRVVVERQPVEHGQVFALQKAGEVGGRVDREAGEALHAGLVNPTLMLRHGWLAT